SKVDFDLYLVADPSLVQRDLLTSVKSAIDGGVKAIQFRGKNLTARELLRTGEKLRVLTAKQSVKFFLNDRLDIAMALDADGIHLGQNGFSAGLARKLTNNRFLVGVSTHNIREAMKAQADGADFVTFGPIFATSSKLVYGPPVGLKRLLNVTKKITIPVFAIGGVKKENIKDVIEKGAYGVAVISAILNARSAYTATVNILDELVMHK
ncbi:MAG: thiamine phosphate synthase, partial [Nitrospira sp.]|nr:thiamine phosphate synthase [Nitrospira sp.]